MAGRSPAELSREFGVSAQSITAWVARAAADAGKPMRGKDVLTTAERDELARLRRRVRQLEHLGRNAQPSEVRRGDLSNGRQFARQPSRRCPYRHCRAPTERHLQEHGRRFGDQRR